LRTAFASTCLVSGLLKDESEEQVVDRFVINDNDSWHQLAREAPPVLRLPPKPRLE
jgi:hypothetical protein